MRPMCLNIPEEKGQKRRYARSGAGGGKNQTE